MQVKEGKKITGPEQLKDAAFGCARIRGDTLGIVGLGTSHWSLCGSDIPIAKLPSSSPSSKPNSRVELVERSLHQQLDHELISDLLSWRPVPNFGISLHPPTSISTNFPNLQRRDSWPQIQCKLWFPKMLIFGPEAKSSCFMPHHAHVPLLFGFQLLSSWSSRNKQSELWRKQQQFATSQPQLRAVVSRTILDGSVLNIQGRTWNVKNQDSRKFLPSLMFHRRLSWAPCMFGRWRK